MELCTHEKAVFFLPVNILMVWSPAFFAVRHTTVCLNTNLILALSLYTVYTQEWIQGLARGVHHDRAYKAGDLGAAHSLGQEAYVSGLKLLM